MSISLFVTGTDTDVGKTVLSALLCAALRGIYWKPIQTGATEGTDRQTVMRWAELPEERTVLECYCFDPPVSPHLAAQRRGVRIELSDIRLPALARGDRLIVEGAGGVMVPVNDTDLMADLMGHLNLPIVVATRTTLGTINHTLLTVTTLRNRGLQVKGVVMLGAESAENQRAIEHYGSVPVIGWVPVLDTIDRQTLLRVFQSNFDRAIFE